MIKVMKVHLQVSHLPSLAICRDEGCVGCRCRSSAISEHPFVDHESMLCLAAPIAGIDDGVVCPDLWLGALKNSEKRVVRNLQFSPKMLLGSTIHGTGNTTHSYLTLLCYRRIPRSSTQKTCSCPAIAWPAKRPAADFPSKVFKRGTRKLSTSSKGKAAETYLAFKGIKHLHGCLPLARLAIDINEDIEGDQIRSAALLKHLSVNIQRQLQLICFDADIHQSTAQKMLNTEWWKTMNQTTSNCFINHFKIKLLNLQQAASDIYLYVCTLHWMPRPLISATNSRALRSCWCDPH